MSAWLRHPTTGTPLRLLAIAGALAAATARPPAAARAQDAVPRFEPGPCLYEDYAIPDGERVECGYLVVAEDRAQPDGLHLRLPVAILRANGHNPAPDPVVFLAGGPGDSGLDWIGYFLEEAPGLHARRDVILFDQRGAGEAQPSTRCTEFYSVERQIQTEGLAPGDELALRLGAAERCRDRLRAEGLDLGAYTTAANAADVAELRQVLGIAEWNLYGLSYGTRLAQTVLRDHPEGVRSVVLDSARPMQVGRWEEGPANMARAYAQLFAGCAAHPACGAAYPDLPARLEALVARLDASPVIVQVPDTETGEMIAQRFDGTDLLNGGFAALYDAAVIPVLPLALVQIEAGNLAVIEGLAAELTRDASRANAGMWFAIECLDETTPATPAETAAAAAMYPPYGGVFASDAMPAVCAVWGAGPAGGREHQPVHSDVPALVLAGDYDPVHPPAWSELTAADLSRSFYYELAGQGHAVSFDGCGEVLVERFLENPLTPPDDGCVAAQTGPDFVTEVHVQPGVYRLAAGLLLNFDAGRAVPLLASTLVLASALAAFPLQRLRRRPAIVADPAARWARWAAAGAALAGVGFVAGLLAAILLTAERQPYLLLFGLPRAARPLFALPWAAALLSLAAAGYAAVAWRRGWWSPAGRVYYTLVALAGVVLTLALASWGLLRLPGF